MKIKLTIDTQEPYTTASNLEDLVMMAVEGIFDGSHRILDGVGATGVRTIDEKSSYVGGDKKDYICEVALVVE